MNLRLSVLASCVLLAACGGKPETDQTATAPAATTPEAAAPAAPAPSGDKVVHVYNWSDYMPDATREAFEKETGIKVVYDVYDSNEILEAKLMAGNSGYDVVFPSARPFADRHIKAGVYAPLEKAKLTGYGNLDSHIMVGLADIDAGNQFVVPYMWGTTGIGINVAKVKEALGENAPLDSWGLLFDPANAAKLADCGITVLDDDQETFGAALLYLGRDPNAHAADEAEAVGKVYAGIRPHVRYFNSSKYIDDLANGDVCVAMGYSGDVFQAADRASEANNGIEIQFVIPKEGALRWVDTMAIPKDAPHKDNAHAFISYLLRPDVIAEISNEVAYANPNMAAREKMNPDLANDPGVYPPDDVMAKLVDPKTLPDDQQRARVRAWTNIKTGR